MKFKRLPKAVILTAVGALSACSGGLPERLAHKDAAIYSFTEYDKDAYDWQGKTKRQKRQTTYSGKKKIFQKSVG